jgi:hypothetical protein
MKTLLLNWITRLVRSRKKTVVKLVHDDDLGPLLLSLDLLSPVENGKIECFICHKTITLDNVGGLIKITGQIQIICDDSDCLNNSNNH